MMLLRIYWRESIVSRNAFVLSFRFSYSTLIFTKFPADFVPGDAFVTVVQSG